MDVFRFLCGNVVGAEEDDGDENCAAGGLPRLHATAHPTGETAN